MNKIITACFRLFTGCFIVSILILPMTLEGQDDHSSKYNRDTLIVSAKELMTSAKYCALITFSESGLPNVRTMNPFAPEKDMTVWLGTNAKSRKVKEIKNNSVVALYYASSGGSGYVVVRGNAYIVNDEKTKNKYWKSEWEEFYEDNKENYMLIKVIPEKLEVVDYGRGIVGDQETWAVPAVDMKQ